MLTGTTRRLVPAARRHCLSLFASPRPLLRTATPRALRPPPPAATFPCFFCQSTPPIFSHFSATAAAVTTATTMASSAPPAVPAAAASYPSLVDPSTRANVTSIRVTHFDLHLAVDFATKTLRGDIEVTARSVDPAAPASSLVLDVKALEVSKVVSIETGEDIAFEVVDTGSNLGHALTIPLAPGDVNTDSGDVRVRVSYATTPQSSAVQWLDAAATKDKVAPFMFTQCQAIHARTLLPCQDTPMVKASYTATVRCPKGTTAIMSALGNGDAPTKTHEEDGSRTFAFRQPIAIASYLVALAVGNLASKEVGPRSAVWAEPSVVEAAAYEFADTEQFIATGEKICGDYVWGRYDVLCMPPSFPFGGMENPCLTFVTPTLLAGDRSLADVVIHEITHSWTGNLVTNRTWEHFWLNEGWTMFVQRKISKALYGQPVADLDAIEGLIDLQDSVDLFGAEHNFTRLIPDLSGDGDPDDAFSTVPYEKGHALLAFIQGQVGGAANMDPFIKAYVAKFGHPTMTLTSSDFRAFATEYFRKHHQIDLDAKVDWQKWFFAPGAPAGVRELFDESLLAATMALKDVWVGADAGSPGLAAEPTAADLDGWTCSQTTMLLKELLDKHTAQLTVAALDKMDGLYGLSARRNAEIRFNWQRICITVGKADIVPRVVEFLREQGRMKFVRPLYRDLLKASVAHPEHAAAFYDAAVQTFAAAEKSYHPIASKMIARDIAAHNAEHRSAAAAAEGGASGL